MKEKETGPSDSVHSIAHTPGPWEVTGPSSNGKCLRIFADEYVGIIGGSDQSIRTIQANADLIAAAPDLLEACKSLLDIWDRAGPMGSHQWEQFEGVVRQCIAAVGKATGEAA